MELNEYQRKAFETALPTTKNEPYMALGIGNEAGEVQGKIKKRLRGDKVYSDDIAKEIGDVLWYCAGLATVLGYDLDEIAQQNIDKLESRKVRGKLQGDGDSR